MQQLQFVDAKRIPWKLWRPSGLWKDQDLDKAAELWKVVPFHRVLLGGV